MLPEDAITFRGGPLSNFAAAPIELSCPHTGALRIYATAEHWFQACKATTLPDHLLIVEQATPRDAKRAGRRIALRPDWEEVKFDVMLAGLRAKFLRPEHRGRLESTGTRFIAEDSPTDFEWGARDWRGGWSGANLMGRALMQVRAELRASAADEPQLTLRL